MYFSDGVEVENNFCLGYGEGFASAVCGIILYIQQDHQVIQQDKILLLTPDIHSSYLFLRTAINSTKMSTSRSWLHGDFGPGPASSSVSPDCTTPPGMVRVLPLSRWRCFICRQRFARVRDLRGHICLRHRRIQELFDRGEFPFFRRCMTCHRQARSKVYKHFIL